MIRSLIRKYFSIVFVLATMMGVFHHHNDLNPHNNCQICTIQASIADADTPVDTLYVSDLEIFSESVVSKFSNLHEYKPLNPKQARAPPKLS